MKLLDVFSGLGGAAMGYHRAGWEVSAVDIEPQPRYPFMDITQADAFEVLGDTAYLDTFDAIHASPVCKLYSVTAKQWGRVHPDQIAPVRELLRAWGGPYVIENVVGAPLIDPTMLCGSMFGLGFDGRVLKRHRLFESNIPLTAPPDACAGKPAVGVYGTGGAWTRTAPGGGGVKVSGADAAAALGIDWTTHQGGLSQAIPPAYTEFIGLQLLDALAAVA